MKYYFFSVICIFVLFMDEMFATFLTVLNIPLASGMLKFEYIGVSLLSYLIFLRNYNQQKRYGSHIIFASLTVGFLMFLTQFFYSQNNVETYNLYSSSLLYFLSGCVSSMIIGSQVASNFTNCNLNKAITYVLPCFVLAIGYIIGTAGLANAKISLFSEEDNILDYQSVSYMMAEIFAFSVYLAFFLIWPQNYVYRILKLINYPLIIYAPFACLASGGRGGSVLLAIYVLFYIVVFFKKGIVPKKTIFPIVLIIIAIAFLPHFISSLESFDGFLRITNSMTTDDGRKELYNSAWKLFKESPIIGHGLGSIWFNQGVYSHNFVLDILAETGLIGLIVVLPIIIKLVFRGLRISIVSSLSMVFYIAFIKGSIFILFSGYWLNALQLWLFFGFCFNKMISSGLKNQTI